MMRGTLGDTYVAAIQHDLADLSGDERLVGVVRRPTRWFHAAVDENLPALGPPADLLDEFATREEDFKMRGVCDEGAHNAAWEELDFEERYRDYLRESTEAGEAMDRIDTWLDAGEDITLVCFENTNEKRCHRTVLREELEVLSR